MCDMNTLVRASSFKREINFHTLMASSDGLAPSDIEILQCGIWDTPYHGQFAISPEDLLAYKAHFDDNLRAGNTLPIDYEHDTDGGAAGWITGLTIKASSKGDGFDSLWASVEWTPAGAQALKDKVYKFFSPEFCPEYYVDPEDFETVSSNVLIGGAITTRPLFKSLKPVMASATGSRKAGEDVADKGAAVNTGQNVIYFQKGVATVPVLDEVRKKASSELTTEDRALLEQNVAELSDEELTKFELKKPEAAVVAPAVTTPVAASDAVKGQTVTISASDLAELQASAKRANEMADRLEKNELTAVITASAEKGRIKPDAVTNWVTILQASSPKVRDQIKAEIEKLPENTLLANEIGSGKDGKVKASDDGKLTLLPEEEFTKKASDLAAEKKITYGQAYRELTAEGYGVEDNETEA